MITPGDFFSLIQWAESEIKDLSILFMTSYSESGAPTRDNFTELILTMLDILTSSQFNRYGSFTQSGAMQALDDETKFTRTMFELEIRIFHRLLELERNQITYSWLEKSWAIKWRPMLYASGQRRLASQISAGIKAGAHKIPSGHRKYVSKAIHDYAPEFGEEIDKLLVAKLPIRRV